MALPSIAWKRVHQYAKIAQELNVAPRKRSPPNGAPEQSGVQGLLYYYKLTSPTMQRTFFFFFFDIFFSFK